MGYDKDQATEEFIRWSDSYDRSILQWLIFGPSHRALIRRIREAVGDRPARILDVGCGTGVFVTRLRAALPRVEVYGVDLVSEMLHKGRDRGGGCIAGQSSRSRGTANASRSPPGRSTS